MKINASHMPQILDALKESNTARIQREIRRMGNSPSSSFRQIIESPEPLTGKVATLERGVYKPLTPILQYRFQYAGRWINGVPGFNFLSLSDMEKVWDETSILEQIQIRRENWENSPPASLPSSQISLFGIDAESYEEIYLEWDEGNEPSVVSYVTNYERRFDDLADFLNYWSKDDDSEQ